MSINISLVGLTQEEAQDLLDEVNEDLLAVRDALQDEKLSGTQRIKMIELKYGLMETRRSLELYNPEQSDGERARRAMRALDVALSALRNHGEVDLAARLEVMVK